ncbi:MAG: hypothetical protein KME09_22230 [Pleurocapsa minor HA4230-MV1]|jgi:hypothetical protein|nr:hypothetical protein [Pleurocapsa minor HA4230-MV1]
MKRKFEFEFEDQSLENTITFEYDDATEEEIDLCIENGVAVMYANSQALLSMAKLFVKIAICDYQKGFHLHLTKDFDADDKEIFRVILTKNESNQSVSE